MKNTSKKNTISIHVGGNYSVIHNNRLTENHSNPDIDIQRSNENIVLVDVPIRKKYDEIFAEAVADFNERQKRSDRKIGNYFQKIRDSKIDEAKEVIFEIGNSEDLKRIAEENYCRIWETKEWDLRTQVLKEYVQEFQEKNPSFIVFNAAIHLDETNPHAHVDFIPVGSNMKKGVSKQVSMNGALADMGYNKTQSVTREKGKQAGKTITQPDNQKNFSEWREEQLRAFKELSKRVYQEHEESFEFVEGSKRKNHLHVDEYKQVINSAHEEAFEITRNARRKASQTLDKREQRRTEELYDTWQEEWQITKKQFPEFEMLKEIEYEDEQEVLEFAEEYGEENLRFSDKWFILINEKTPRLFELDFDEMIELFQEKFQQLKTYISSEWQKLAHKASKIEIRENNVLEKENRLKAKLGAFNDEVEKFSKTVDVYNETSLTFLKSEPKPEYRQIADRVSRRQDEKKFASFKLAKGVSGVSLEELKIIVDTNQELESTIELQRSYIKNIQFENKKLKEPDKYMSFEDQKKRKIK